MTTEVPSLSQPKGRRDRDGDALERVRRRPDLSARSIATHAAAVALWLLVCSSAVSGLLALARVRAVQGGSPAVAAAPAGPGGIEGFAELYVSAYLEGSEGAVRTFYPSAPALDAVREGDRYVARAASVGVRATGRHAWSVTVGAEVLVAAEGRYRRDGIHYLQVGIARSSDGYVATSLPSEVAGPAGR